jgi:Ca2+-binding RTX toxin-like protein
VVTENLSTGGTVGFISATDAEDQLTYTLTNDGNGAFELVGRELKVKDSTKLDYEQFKQVQFEIEVSDGVNDPVVFTKILNIEDLFRETVLGTPGNNVIRGGAGNDSLTGRGGSDILSGGEGQDLLRGDALPNDTTAGEPGADVFLFDSRLNANTNVDVIADFNRSQGDKIYLSNATGIFGPGLGADNTVLDEDAFFVVGSGPQDAEDRIVYDPTTGILSFDPGGNGGALLAFARVVGNPQLQNTDFFIV